MGSKYRQRGLTLLHFLCIPDNTVTRLHSVSPRRGHATLERRRGIDHGRHLRGHISNVQMFPRDPAISEVTSCPGGTLI